MLTFSFVFMKLECEENFLYIEVENYATLFFNLFRYEKNRFSLGLMGRVVPDIKSFLISGLFAGYQAGRITGYPAHRFVFIMENKKLLNK